MRLVDKRTRLSRRDFLATGGAAALIVGTGSLAAPSGAWSMEVTSLQPATMRTLIQVSRDIYPHDRLADHAYATALAPYDAAAAEDASLKQLLESGVADLNAKAEAAHGVEYVQVGWEGQRVALLQSVETTEFFQKLRGDLLSGLYNNQAIWPKFGYEGASADKGGYLERGFDDIDWV
jgi:hypothetical protein